MVSKFIQPDMTTQDAASYKANIDGAIAVLAQMGAGFAPRAELPAWNNRGVLCGEGSDKCMPGTL